MSEHRKTDGTVTVKGADGKIIGNVAAQAIQSTPNSVTVSVTISLEEQGGVPDTEALSDILDAGDSEDEAGRCTCHCGCNYKLDGYAPGEDTCGACIDICFGEDRLCKGCNNVFYSDGDICEPCFDAELSDEEENSYWEMHTDAASDANAPAYLAANEERRARIRREIEDKPLMNYKYAYCPDCGQQVRVVAVRDSVTAASHEGCPYGHLRREVEFDFDRECADIIVGDDEGEPLNGYIALWRNEQVEVYAKTTFEAQQFSIAYFRALSGRRKVDPADITVVLAEKGGSPVTHSGEIF